MVYESEAKAFVNTSNIYPAPTPARDVPAAVGALHELGEAAHVLAACVETYIQARIAWQDALSKYNHLREIVAKESEQAGI